jgi:hypothetical protein
MDAGANVFNFPNKTKDASNPTLPHDYSQILAIGKEETKFGLETKTMTNEMILCQALSSLKLAVV